MTTKSSSRDDPQPCQDKFLLVDESLAKSETRVIYLLRGAVILVLLVLAVFACCGVYIYTRNDELAKFAGQFAESALQIMDSFDGMVERNMGAAAAMSAAITSYATHNNLSFPFVTLPDFELMGSHLRAQSGSHVVHWMPLVSEEQREDWESYAYQNRFQIDEAYSNDQQYRSKQDDEFSVERDGNRDRVLAEEEARNETVLQDGTDYHMKIWSNGGRIPRGDIPIGNGPYLPTWQRSPIDPGRQNFLNMDLAQGKALDPGVYDTVVKGQKASLRSAFVPVPKFIPFLEANLRLSQYRENVEEIVGGLSTFLAYPVFDSLSTSTSDRKVVGVLGTNVYWKILFSRLLPSMSKGIVCVVQNSYNQTFSYRIDGHDVSFLGMGDFHEPKYGYMGISMDVHDSLESQANPVNRAYTTVPLSDDVMYTVRAYPSEETENQFVTNNPLVYTLGTTFAFAFISVLFLMFSCSVERRHTIMLSKVIENAQRAAQAERELNEFLSHEVRNPLSSAMSACSFVSAAVNGPEPLNDAGTIKDVQEDIEVVQSSLNFINEFLRSMLDLHRAHGNQIKFEMTPIDLLRDVLLPVSAILYKRVANFEVFVDCPENLTIMTDSIRLKQVVLNLARNSVKFVEHGFLRLRATIDANHQVFVFVEDSGPGLSVEKRKDLFAKYQTSLDRLSQGTGLGLSLAKKLMQSMGGDLWLDETYHSGIESSPGACFVVQLNVAPLNLEATLPPNQSDCDDPTESITNSGASPAVLEVLESTRQKMPVKDPSVVVSAHGGVSSETSAAVPGRQPSVLFVDDDAMVRKLFVRGLKRAQPDWDIQEASSGEMALRMCESQQHEFDLIFLDQYMASVEKQLLGSETCHAMRSRGIKSVICGLSANDMAEMFLNSGANDFILKPMPCKQDELKKTLARLLGWTDAV